MSEGSPDVCSIDARRQDFGKGNRYSESKKVAA